MLLGLIQYVLQSRYLGKAGLHPASTGNAEADARQRRSAIIAVVAGLAVFATIAGLAASGVLSVTSISNALGAVLLGITLVVFSWMIGSIH